MTNPSEKARTNLWRWHTAKPRPILDLTASRCGLTLRCKCTVDTLQQDIVELGLGTSRELGTLSFSTRDDVLEADVAIDPPPDREWVLIRSANGSVCSFLEHTG